ncbi:MAG: Fur family transcriptional regulator [Planctomycetota bacterium]
MKTDGAELLRNHGMQVTAQRLAILRAVADAPHCTADDVAEGVRSELGTISRQAVYDALNLLVEKRLLRRIQPAGSAALYEDRVGDNHHHVICRVCGQTEDVDCAAGKAPCLNAVTDSGYRIDEAEVIYWGTCPRCLPKKKRSAKAKTTQTASRTKQTASRTKKKSKAGS